MDGSEFAQENRQVSGQVIWHAAPEETTQPSAVSRQPLAVSRQPFF